MIGLFVSLLVSSSPVSDGPWKPDPAAVRTPCAIEGTWELVAQETGGRVSRPPAGQFIFTFRGGKAVCAAAKIVQTVRIDEHHTPAWIAVNGCPGIWQVSGNTLKIALGNHGSRPTSFEGTEAGRFICTYQRVAGR